MKHKDKSNYLTLDNVYKRLRDCLEAVKPNDKKLSRAMRERLDYNIYFLRLFVELQEDKYTDVQAIGFEIESERDYEYDDEDDEDEKTSEDD